MLAGGPGVSLLHISMLAFFTPSKRCRAAPRIRRSMSSSHCSTSSSHHCHSSSISCGLSPSNCHSSCICWGAALFLGVELFPLLPLIFIITFPITAAATCLFSIIRITSWSGKSNTINHVTTSIELLGVSTRINNCSSVYFREIIYSLTLSG